MPGAGAAGNNQALNQAVGQLAPFATQFHGPMAGTAIPQVTPQTYTPQPSNISKFAHFIGGVGSEIGHIASGAASWLGKNTVNAIEAPAKYGASIAHGWQDRNELTTISNQSSQVSDQIDNLHSLYKAGKITNQQYQKELKDLNQDLSNLVSQNTNVNQRISTDQKQAVKSTIDTASLILTIASAGFGKAASVAVAKDGLVPIGEKQAADYLTSSATDGVFGKVESTLANLASKSELFKGLAPVTQKAIQESVAEVIAGNAGTMTAGQIARASAMNLALKYPIYFNALSSTGSQIYNELDNKKYGDAVRTVAFNAALVLSGGLIGQAWKYGGKFLNSVSEHTFGQTAFWDELSKFYGDGSPSGFRDAIENMASKMNEADRADFLKNLSAVEATNVGAVGGDAAAGARRVAQGMKNVYGFDLSQIDHEGAVKDMVNFASAHRLVYEDALKRGLSEADAQKYAVGRWTVFDNNRVMTAISGADKASIDQGLFKGPTPSATMADEAGFMGYRGVGKNLHPGGDLFGQAIYVARDPETAKAFGNVSKAEINIPEEQILKIGSQQEYEQLTGRALHKYIGEDAQTAIPKYVQSLGYKAVEASPGFDPLGGVAVYDKNVASQVSKRALGEAGSIGAGPSPDDVREYAKTFGVSEAQATKDLSKVARTSPQLGSALQEGKSVSPESFEQIKQARLNAWEALKAANPNAAFVNNANLERQITNLINTVESPAELQTALGSIKTQFGDTGVSKGVADKLTKLGYVPIKPVNIEAPFKEGTGELVSKFGGGESDIFTKSVQPLPVLGFVGRLLTSAGLSPNASTERVYQLFNDNLSRNLEESGVLQSILGEDSAQSTDTMLKKLTDYAHGVNLPQGVKAPKMPIQDFRMMTTKQISQALGVSSSDARSIQNAISKAYLQVPLAVRGLGDRLVDATYRFKPTAAVERRYLKLQGSLRFAWNPFFQYLRVIPKTEYLTESEGGGVINSIFTGRLGQIESIRNELRASGMFEQAGRIGNVISGEAVDYGGTIGKNLTKKLLPMQERSIAGLIDSQAQRMGMDVSQYIQTFPQQVRDTVQAIASYSRNSNFLNSPLARTMNVAFFPFRFESKVAGYTARALASQPLMTQVAFVKGLMQAHQWLNSDEGRAWYAHNSDVIGLMKYVSPIASMNEVFQSLLPGHDHSLGNFGELGGLPFGWIPQLLDAEGITHFSAPGVNPKTGEVFPTYVPATSKGQLAIAVQDLVSTLFSYPGATVGLPSKTSISRSIALGLTGAQKKTDLNLVTPTNLSKQQQDYIDTIQRLSNSSPTNPKPLPPAPLRQGVTVPASPNPFPTRSRGTNRKLKKSEFTPALLPGQTTLGQL